jgi:hypothetical protein
VPGTFATFAFAGPAGRYDGMPCLPSPVAYTDKATADCHQDDKCSRPRCTACLCDGLEPGDDVLILRGIEVGDAALDAGAAVQLAPSDTWQVIVSDTAKCLAQHNVQCGLPPTAHTIASSCHTPATPPSHGRSSPDWSACHCACRGRTGNMVRPRWQPPVMCCLSAQPMAASSTPELRFPALGGERLVHASVLGGVRAP